MQLQGEITINWASKKREEAPPVWRKPWENLPLVHMHAVHWCHLLQVIYRLFIENEILLKKYQSSSNVFFFLCVCQLLCHTWANIV